jgi:HSP20 family molecular chaperone IbpA
MVWDDYFGDSWLGTLKDFNGYSTADKKDYWQILIKAPGYSKDDLNIDVNNICLNVSGKSKYGEMNKKFSIPENIKKVEVDIYHGMIDIKLIKNKSSTIPVVYK